MSESSLTLSVSDVSTIEKGSSEYRTNSLSTERLESAIFLPEINCVQRKKFRGVRLTTRQGVVI